MVRVLLVWGLEGKRMIKLFSYLPWCMGLLGLLACGSASSLSDEERQQAKQQVRRQMAASRDDAQPNTRLDAGVALHHDHCADYGWYADGFCDDWCPRPDPDCRRPGRPVYCDQYVEWPNGWCGRRPGDPCRHQDPDCSDGVTPESGGCVYHAKRYNYGDAFSAGDGCNLCACGAAGEVSCTQIECLRECRWGVGRYIVGERRWEQSQTCTCVARPEQEWSCVPAYPDYGLRDMAVGGVDGRASLDASPVRRDAGPSW